MIADRDAGGADVRHPWRNTPRGRFWIGKSLPAANIHPARRGGIVRMVEHQAGPSASALRMFAQQAS